MNTKFFRPQFIEKENMLLLGFDLISDKNGYLEYQNNATVHWNKGYNRKSPEPKGKVVININCTYSDNCFYLARLQDGGTRKSYMGVCDSELFLKLLLTNNR